MSWGRLTVLFSLGFRRNFPYCHLKQAEILVRIVTCSWDIRWYVVVVVQGLEWKFS
jgi:hypothetical protein